MTPLVKNGIASLAALAAGAMIVLGTIRIVERQRTAEQITLLREGLYTARVTADRCRASLQTSGASLRSLGLIIDSLKSRVDSFETMDGRGVPTSRYTEYLELFDSYNDSVAVWGGRERRLRSSESACRATIGRHNELSDSLQSLIQRAGIESS